MPVTWTIEPLAGGLVRVAFAGRGGWGSQGNPDGTRMREAIREAFAESHPVGLVVDLRDFDYRFGNWIAAVAVVAWKPLGSGHICLLATGETADSLHRLWDFAQLDRLIPIFGRLEEAMDYLSTSNGCPTVA